MKVCEAKPDGKNKKIGIVASLFNDFITKKLLEGCLDECVSLGIKKKDITVVWVPGAFEIPLAALKLAKKKNIQAVICLGDVIKGETHHFELVAQSAASGINQAALLSGKPIIFEVLATETVDQALKRSTKRNNKGRDAAVAAVEMANLMIQLSH